MDSSILKCSCGGTRFARIKMGGDPLVLQWPSKKFFSAFSGFYPDTLACKACGKILLIVPENEKQRLKDAETTDGTVDNALTPRVSSTGIFLVLFLISLLGVVCFVLLRNVL